MYKDTINLDGELLMYRGQPPKLKPGHSVKNPLEPVGLNTQQTHRKETPPEDSTEYNLKVDNKGRSLQIY